MRKKGNTPTPSQKEESANNPAESDTAAAPVIQRLRAADKRMQAASLRVPPLSDQQIHAIVSLDQPSQFQIRLRADCHLLILCLMALAVLASILLRTAPTGLTGLNVALLLFSLFLCWVALRAGCSLWLMQQTLRLRLHPYRMSRYSDWLARLSHRRRHWLQFVLSSNYSSYSPASYRRVELVSLRLPSYFIALCLLLFITFNTSQSFASSHHTTNVITNCHQNDTTICHTVDKLIAKQ